MTTRKPGRHETPVAGPIKGDAGEIANIVAERMYDRFDPGGDAYDRLSDLMAQWEAEVLGWIDPEHDEDTRFGSDEAFDLAWAQGNQELVEYLAWCARAYLERPDVAARLDATVPA